MQCALKQLASLVTEEQSDKVSVRFFLIISDHNSASVGVIKRQSASGKGAFQTNEIDQNGRTIGTRVFSQATGTVPSQYILSNNIKQTVVLANKQGAPSGFDQNQQTLTNNQKDVMNTSAPICISSFIGQPGRPS
jgi:hypothetical protein